MTWSKDDSNRRARRTRDRGRPHPPASNGDDSVWEASRRKAEKRRRRLRVSWIIGGIAAALLLAIALLPTIASWVAPGIIASSASNAIAGRVEVDSVSLSWFGNQRVSNVRLYDREGNDRGELTVVADKGLLGLALAGGDYGTVTLSGRLDLSPDAQGRTFVEHTAGPADGARPAPQPAPPSAEPPRLPVPLRATLVLDNLQIEYTDPAPQATLDSFRLERLRGSVALDTTGETTADIAGDITTRRTADRLYNKSGAIAIAASVRDLVAADGLLTPARAEINARAAAENISTDLLDILPQFEGLGPDAIGPDVTIAIEATGTGADLAVLATADAQAFEARAPLAVNLDASTVRSAEPITARLDLARLSLLVPDRDALIGPDADVAVTEYPEINLAVTDLQVPIPRGESLDLRNAGALVTVEIGRLAARLAGEGPGSVGLEPATITLNATDLADGVTLQTAMNTLIDGARAGTLRVDLAADRLLDETGAPITGSAPRVRGEVRAESLALAAFQPFAHAAGVDLTGLLGQTADLALVAAPLESDDPAATRFTINGKAEHASIEGNAALENNTLRGGNIVARLDRLTPALAEPLAAAGVTLNDASGAAFRVQRFQVNLDELAAGNLAGVSFQTAVALNALSATLDASGDTIATRAFVAQAESASLAQGVRVNGNVRLAMNDQPAGALTADLRVAGILDNAGAIRDGLPEDLSGELRAQNIRTAAVQPFLAGTGIELPQDIGPTIDLALTAAASPDASATIPPTDITLSVTSQHLNGGGALRLAADRLTTTGDGLSITLANPGNILARGGSLGERAALTRPGTLALSVRDLALPLDAEGAPEPARAAGRITLSLDDVELTANNEAVALSAFNTTATLAPDQAPQVTMNGTTRAGGVEGTIDGQFRIENAFAPFADDGALAARPVGTLTVANVPAAVLGLAGITLPADGRADIALADAASNLLGSRLNLQLETSGDAERLAVRAAANSPRLNLTADAALRPGPAGALDVAAVNARGTLAIDQRALRTAMMVSAPRQYHAVSMPNNTTARLNVNTSDAGVIKAAASLDRVTIADLPVPDETGGFRKLEPIDLVGDAEATLPVALLAAAQGPQPVNARANLNGFATADPETRVLSLVASLDTTLVDAAPSGKTTAELRLTSQKTAWLDALAGLDGLLVNALGQSVRLDATLAAAAAADGSMGDGTAEISVRSPLLQTASPARLRLQADTLALAEPVTANWTLTTRLLDTLMPQQPGATGQVRIPRNVPVTFTAERFRMPLAGAAGATATDVKAIVNIPALPLRFPDGTEQEYRDFSAALATNPGSKAARLVVTAVDPASQRAGKALRLDALLTGLPDGSDDWSPFNIALTGDAVLNDFPVRLLDAMAAGDGAVVELLGQNLQLNAKITDFPKAGGTFVLDTRTEQARAGINATVRPHPRNPDLLAATLDQPLDAVLTHFQYDVQNKSVPLLPIFASITKIQREHEPASVNISRLVAPVDGDLSMIIMDGTVTPGVVAFDIDQGLGTLLKAIGQREQGRVGERLQPFTIGMNRGIARFSDLAVPVGEFTFKGEGQFDLVRQTEDILLYIPAGAFSSEVLGSIRNPLGGTLNTEIMVPVRRKGPLGAKNPWKPDFGAVLKEMFSPENLIKEGLGDRLKDLLPGRSGGGG